MLSRKKTKEEAKRALEEVNLVSLDSFGLIHPVQSRQEEIRRNEERRAAEQLV